MGYKAKRKFENLLLSVWEIGLVLVLYIFGITCTTYYKQNQVFLGGLNSYDAVLNIFRLEMANLKGNICAKFYPGTLISS